MTHNRVLEVKPLAEKRIVVTRARHQAADLVRLLEEAGALVLVSPAIQIGPPDSWEPLDRAIRELGTFRWVLFTSVNGVDAFRQRMEQLGLTCSALQRARIAAIGPATAEALFRWGCPAELVPDEYRAEGLAERLRPEIRPGDRILIPRAAEAREVLVRILSELGGDVTEVPAYRTRPARGEADRLKAAFQNREVDAVTFTSSSTARSFAELFTPEESRELLDGVVNASIGPITAEALAAYGLTTHVMPTEYTIPALARALIAYYGARE
ncbi:MAG: uroporphyrinogen-III synthase [Candidatus Methylomirabilia bacterium]